MATGFSFEEAQKPQAFSFEDALKPQAFSFEDADKPQAFSFEEAGKPEDQSIFRSVADIPLKTGAGVVSGIRMIADAFGAGSSTSKALKGAEDWIADLYSAQSKRDSKKIAQIIEDAKDAGAWEQVKAGFSAFSEAPVDIIAQGLGTAAPTVLAGLAATIFGAPAALATAGGLGLGAIMGAGTIKGAIYDAVKEELAKTDMPADQIEARANLAQQYNGENLDQILTGAAIGSISARTGLESSVAKAAAARIAGKAAAAEAAEAAARQKVTETTAQAAARGPLLQGAITGAKETGSEFLQGGQEQLAQNVALQREGFDVPTFRSVVAQGTLEGLAGGPLGGAFGAREAVVARQEQQKLRDIEDIRSLTDTSSVNTQGDLDEQFGQLSTQYQTKLSKESADELALRTIDARQEAEARAASLGVALPTDIVPDPERVQQLEESWRSSGVNPELARVEAVTQATEEAFNDWLAGQEEQKSKESAAGTQTATTGQPDPKRVEQIVDDLTTAGVPLAEAQTAAVAQATAEASRAAAQGAQNVGRPLDQSGGTGVRVAGEPLAGTAALGTEGTQPTSVESFTAGLGQPAGGTGTPPGTLTTGTAGEALGTKTPQTVETKEKGPEVPSGGAAATEATAATPAAPAKQLGPLQLAKKLAHDAFAEPVEEGVNRYEAREQALRRARSQVEETGNKSAISFFNKEVDRLRRGSTFDPIAFAVASADTGIDQKNIADNRDNLIDTLDEYGIKDQYVIEAALSAFDERINSVLKTGKPATQERAVKFSLSNKRFSEVPKPSKLYRASTEKTRYPGKFWTALKELAERYAKKATGAEQRAVTEVERLPRGRTLNITTVSQLPDTDKQTLLADFRSWMTKNALDANIEDTYLYEVLANGESDFIYPTPHDAKYLKYKGYGSVYFAQEGGETVDTWFVFDKRERAEKTAKEDTEAIGAEKRGRGRPAKPAEEKEASTTTAKANRAKSNRDTRAIRDAVVLFSRAKNLGVIEGRPLRNDGLHLLYDVYSTAVFTPQKTRAKEVLDAQGVTQEELDALKKSHAEWKADWEKRKQAEVEAKATSKADREKKRDERAQKRAAAPTVQKEQKAPGKPGRPKLTQEEINRRADEKKKKADARVEANAQRMAVRTQQIAYSLQDKLGKLARKIITLSNRVVSLTKNKPKVVGEPGSIENDKFAIWELKHAIATKQSKYTQIEVKLTKEEPVNWDTDWEQGTAVKGLNAATKEIDGLQTTLKKKMEELAAKQKEAEATKEKPAGAVALADKFASDAFTNLDQYKGEDQYEKLENAVSNLRFALQTELENRGIKKGAYAPTLARFDKKVADLRRDAVSRNPILDPEYMGRNMANAAFDQGDSDLESSIGAAQDNLIYTLNEYKAGVFANSVALQAFDARVDELRKKEEPAEDKWAGVKRTTRGTIEMVPTSSLDGIKQRNKTNTESASYAALKASVAKQGIVDPITLAIDPVTNKVEVFEGNHRLQVARELGIEQVPVVLHERINPSESVALEGRKPSSVLPAAQKTKAEDSGIYLVEILPDGGVGRLVIAFVDADSINNAVAKGDPFDRAKEDAEQSAVEVAVRQLSPPLAEGAKIREVSKDQYETYKELKRELEGGPAPVAPSAQPATEATPKEQYDSLIANVPGAPTYESLSDKAKGQIDDLAKRGVLNLAAVNQIVTADSTLQPQAQVVKGPIAPVDPAFKGFKTASEALNHIRKTGSPFQKFLAWRIASAIKNRGTKFVVVEVGDPLPSTFSSYRNYNRWLGALGVFNPSTNTIYVKGESFGDMQGVNTKVVLHELLHAATYWKIRSGKMAIAAGRKVDTQVAKAIADLTSLMLQAKDHYLSLQRTRRLENDIGNYIDSFIGLGEAGVVRYELFTNQDEFLAHGLTGEPFMRFLRDAPGFQNRGSLRSWFVDIVRRLLGLPKKDRSALTELLDITDRIVKAKPILVYDLQPAPTSAILAMAQVPTPPQTPSTPSAAQTATKVKQQKKRVDKSLQKAQRANLSSPSFFNSLRQLIGERDPTLFVDILTSKFDAFKGGALRQIIALVSNDVLVNWATRLGVKNVGTAHYLVKDMEAMRNKLKADAAPIGDALLKLQRKDPDMYTKLGTVMHYATLRGIDPATDEGRKKSTALKDLWEKLDPEAQKIYVQVRDAYLANYNRYYAILSDTINSYPLEGDPNDASTPKGNLLASIRRMQETGKRISPYFPLMRYGQFWVRIGKGKAGKFYMFESQSDKELFIKQWFRDEKKRNPRADLTEMRKDKLIADGNSISTAREDLAGFNDIIKRMFENIDAMKVENVTDDFGNALPEYTKVKKEVLKDDIYQLILQTVPDASFRKHFIHRQGKEGFSADISRNFATLSNSMANQLSRLKYFSPIMNAVGSAQAELSGNPDKAKLEEFVQEMRLRAESDLMPTAEDSVGNRLATFTNKAAFFYLMSSVKTAVAQFSAIPVFVAPVLGSNHGVLKTAAAIGRFSAIWNSLGMQQTNPDGSVSWVAPTIAQSKRVKLNPEERLAAQYMIDRGLSDNTLAFDLGDLKRRPTAQQNSLASRAISKIANAMTALFHHVERLIREVTFMASFRLYRAENPNMPWIEVAKLAEKESYEALNDYSASNRPRGIGAIGNQVVIDARKPLGKAILQFKMFPAFVITYFVRNFYRMMGKGYTKQERKKAAIQFFGSLSMSFALAGVMGVPGVSFAFGVLSGLRNLMLGDDEDDPLEKRDLLFWFRNVWLPQTFGQVASNWIDRGAVAGLTGIDITGSLSMNNLFFPEQKETASAQDGAMEFFASLMGPFAGLAVKQIPRAFDLLNQGKIMEGMEQLMPAMVRSPMTAARYAKEGVTTGIGAPIKEASEFTLGQIIGQALGFSTEGLVARREALFKYNSLRLQVENEKRELLDRIDLDLRKGEDIDKTLDKILKFNRKNPFNPIEFDTLSNSLQKRAERRAATERGAPLEPKYYPQLEQLLAPSLRKLEAEAK